MLLAIDIGNSNIAFGLNRDGEWTNHYRIKTVPDKTADEYSVLFRELLSNSGVALETVAHVVLSSVVPMLTGTFTELSQKLFGKPPLVIGPGVRTGIRIRTDNPVEVGTDLVVNAVAAFSRYGVNAVVVDFGTALTFTAVTKQGDLVGVAIAPGLNAATLALSKNTAQLPRVQLSPPPTALGKNTTHSIQAGIVFGYAGLIGAVVKRMREELGGEVRVIATGGLSGTFARFVQEIDEVDPWLTLDGLKLVSEKNR